MWQNRALIVLCVILIGAADFFDSNSFIGGAEARFFSEDGGFEQNQPQDKPSEDELAYYDLLLQKQQEKQENVQLSDVLDELYAQEIAAEQQRAAEELAAAQEAENYYAAESPSKSKSIVESREETEKVSQPPKIEPVKEIPIPVAENRQPPTAQKKGQSEFVEFVEPPAAKAMKSVDSFDKRRPAEHLSNTPNRGIHLLSTTGNIMFVVVVAFGCVASVVGVVGGVYYFKNKKNPENDFDDFTRYSPAGPAKKLASLRNNGIRMDENGDDSLAYKAQLHHYQQTKQKIIGLEEGGLSGAASPAGSPHSIHHGENSEDEAEDLEEHNYSVYECPGLAPTTDLEINNPNFSHH